MECDSGIKGKREMGRQKMTVRDQRTLDVIDEVSRTADRLARRMGGQYVLDGKWRNALDEQEKVARSTASRVSA
ncbi:hypothetical protein KRZ98_14795 [Sphingobium sp. AS12]|uniref:hypothetical protein n=1 Tax=Sphingobium sp. AS12 TaxID=2849495 RepID=UPI001C31C2DE|nr:hypothetical protein [Sphingobium sp. AS12]MBV2149538.1 hypothetical protein [Sphingobium sp. AS12]